MSAIKSPVCGRGHKWDGKRKNGHDYCKTCQRDRQRARRGKLRAARKTPRKPA